MSQVMGLLLYFSQKYPVFLALWIAVFPSFYSALEIVFKELGYFLEGKVVMLI